MSGKKVVMIDPATARRAERDSAARNHEVHLVTRYLARLFFFLTLSVDSQLGGFVRLEVEVALW